MENEECRKCGVWKMRSLENGEGRKCVENFNFPFQFLQYSTVQYSIVQYTVWFRTVQYSTVQCSTVHHSTMQYNKVQYCHSDRMMK